MNRRPASPPSAPLAAIVARDDGLRLRVRLTPRASRDAVGAVETFSDGGSALVVHVRAVPSEGGANAALVALLAKALGVPRSRIDIVAGATSRLKTLHVVGDPAALAATLETLARRAAT